MSDRLFVPRHPLRAIDARARRTQRQIRAARPDFIDVNLDLVDDGSPPDLAFDRHKHDQELGDA
ncbi:hypothetical protein PUR28_00085, partial [Streptomyces sp. BE308]|uniref:hypothetical protein n=1 Tax=Streptomyces sp. BE308 TaxID=3002529 RepID=UPI002E793E8E